MGLPANPNSLPFTVPASLVVDVGDVFDEFPGPVLATLLHAVGEEFELEHGRPVTRLVRDLAPDDDVALVETTLAFPGAGAVWIEGVRFTYTAASDGSFNGLTSEHYRSDAIPAGTEVELDVLSVPPVEV